MSDAVGGGASILVLFQAFSRRALAGRVSGTVWGPILDPFWGSGRILASERVLGVVWGGSGAILDAKMGPTWLPKWHQVGHQIAQKSILADSGSRPCLGNRLGRLRNDFGTQHGPNLGPFWDHVGQFFGHIWVLLWHLNLRPFSKRFLAHF